jgi:multiple sugar transport system permease protein
MKQRFTLKRAFTYAVLVTWSAVCIFPLYWVFLASLKGEEAIVNGPRFIPFLDFTPNLEAWRFILLDSHENLLEPLYNSTVVAVAATGLAIMSACMMLYAITRFQNTEHLKNRGLLWAVLATRILSPACIVIPLYMMAHVAGLLDTQLALIITYSAINLPVAVWLLLPVFGKRATEQEESATMEGAGSFYVLWHILLPMLFASVASVALIVFILCWNEYLFAAYLTTNHASTLTPWMVGQLSLKEAQIGGEPEEWAHLSAATVLMVTPLLIFAGVLQRFLTRRSAAN